MNEARLKALSDKAAAATKLACEIRQLTEADPYRSGARIKLYDYNTNVEYLGMDRAKHVFAAGRLVQLAEMEKELESLLGCIKEDQTCNAEPS